MLLAALKLQVVAMITVAGINTDDITKGSPVAKVLETLDTEIIASRKDPAKQDSAKAEAAFKVAVEAISNLAKDEKTADKDALYVLGAWSRGGVLSGVNGAQVLDIYEKAAEKGQIRAKVDLAQLISQAYAQDPKRIEQVRKLLEEAEAADNNAARFSLANLKINGQAGYTVDVKAAQALLEKGSAAGDGACTFGLYQLVSQGIKVSGAEGKVEEVIKQDQKAAVALLEKALEQNSAEAMTEKARRLLTGDDNIKKDEAQAVQVYTKAAEKGLPYANRQMGILSQNGELGVTKDDKKAIEFFTKAAQGSDPVALLWLGNASQNGYPADAKDEKDVLIQRNPTNALTLYRQAAAGNQPEALFNVGMFYEQGALVDKDPVKAFALYHKAALAGLPAAMLKVGGFYQQGGGSVAQDPIAARGWFQIAANAGLPQAQMILGSLMLQEGAAMQAATYFEAAAIAGSPQAMTTLAALYNTGAGKEKGAVSVSKTNAWVWGSLALEAIKDNEQAKAEGEKLKTEVDKVFSELSTAEKDVAKKALVSKRDDIEKRRKGPAAAAPATK